MLINLATNMHIGIKMQTAFLPLFTDILLSSILLWTILTTDALCFLQLLEENSGVISLKRSGSMRSIDDTTVASYSSTPYFSSVLSNLLNQRNSDQGVIVNTTLKTFLVNKRLNSATKDENEHPSYTTNNIDGMAP